MDEAHRKPGGNPCHARCQRSNSPPEVAKQLRASRNFCVCWEVGRVNQSQNSAAGASARSQTTHTRWPRTASHTAYVCSHSDAPPRSARKRQWPEEYEAVGRPDSCSGTFAQKFIGGLRHFLPGNLLETPNRFRARRGVNTMPVATGTRHRTIKHFRQQGGFAGIGKISRRRPLPPTAMVGRLSDTPR